MRVWVAIAALVLMGACSSGSGARSDPGTTTTNVASASHLLCGSNGNCQQLFRHGGATRAQAECLTRATRLAASSSMAAGAKCVGSLQRLGQIIAAASEWAAEHPPRTTSSN